MMAEGHAMHEQQAILSTMVVIIHTFCMKNENNLTPRRQGACQSDPTMQLGHAEANLSSPYVIILPLLLDPSEYNLGQLPVPPASSSICAALFGWGLITFTPFHVPCHMTQVWGESRITSHVHCIATNSTA